MDIVALKNIDPRTVNRDELVERSTVQIEQSASQNERLVDFVRQIKNPYCYKDGKTVVKISFSETKTTIEDCISHYLKGL